MTLEPLSALLPAVVAQLAHHNPGRTPMTDPTPTSKLPGHRGERAMSAYTDFVEFVPRYRAENPAQRDGQAHFNALCTVRLDIANEVSGGPADPFYFDDRLPAFHQLVAERMGES